MLGLMIKEAHGLAHVTGGGGTRKIMKDYGFWALYLLEQIDYVKYNTTICLKKQSPEGCDILTPTGPMCE